MREMRAEVTNTYSISNCDLIDNALESINFYLN